MDVLLQIRRENTTLFLDVKDTDRVEDVKKIIENILNHNHKDQELFLQTTLLDNTKSLCEYGIKPAEKKGYDAPVTIMLAYGIDPPVVKPYSTSETVRVTKDKPPSS